VRSGNAKFINIGGLYPKNAFTAVIFERSLDVAADVSDSWAKRSTSPARCKLTGASEILVSSREWIVLK
jgi:hypothetical protein